jgi:hypothetical protein
VPVAKGTAPKSSRKVLTIAGVLLIGLLGGAGLLALSNRLRHSGSATANANKPAVVAPAASESPTSNPSPTPDVTRSPSPTLATTSRPENRKAKEQPKKEKKESKANNIINRVKRIFKK